MKQSEKLKGSYLSQILYGLREEEPGKEIITDNEFWDDNVEKEYPFVFLSLIQVDKNEGEKGEFSAGWERRREFEKRVNTGNKNKAIVYMSFDSSDMILGNSKNGYTIKVEEFPLNNNNWGDNMLRGVTSIDGAILSDLKGYCQ